MGLRVKDNPLYYEKAHCSRCKEAGVELMKHKFSDVLTCLECVNDELKEISSEEKHGDYRDKTENELYQGRNQ